ncbi:DnaD domain-containing protein [Sporolactobacillus sp. CPB3-1]|uniref:DnaD domain-containing protein n=1 Tax=Sporolactobacillus mangiferae TaxID=2940498 RepID=A0ABT0MCL7_9BACL|nr:DnaD domain-containing protein [Sporolactobacillus mangiferae]MCL1632606.1 DnaD domain-containing protein [Sporolactobacillus mangiferae]
MDVKFLVKLIENSTVSVPSLLIEYYHKIGLDEQECMMLIQVHSFLAKGDDFPTFDDLAKRMSLDGTDCADLLRKLIQRGYLSIIQKNDQQLYAEAYSLDPLWEKLIRAAYRSETDMSVKDNENTLYTLFETEFGRPLSPIECETLAMWMDQDRHSPVLIKAALREAVVSGKLNFRYIDRILFDWKKNGIKTLEQAKAHGERIRSRQIRSSEKREPDETPKMPTYNWLGQGE